MLERLVVGDRAAVIVGGGFGPHIVAERRELPLVDRLHDQRPRFLGRRDPAPR